MAFVCPEEVIGEYSEARRHFTVFYENCTIVPFPEAHRPFSEVVVFGHKRSRPRVNHGGHSSHRFWESIQAAERFRYELPPSSGPRVFQKVEPT
jgi:hypothetical protein